MTTALTYDLVCAAILILFLWLGIRKGLVLSLCSLLGWIIAFLGAWFLADVLTPVAVDWFSPGLATTIESKLGEEFLQSVTNAAGALDDELASSVLNVLHLPTSFSTLVQEHFTLDLSQVSLSVAKSVVTAVASPVIFILGFLVVLLIWYAISHGLDKVARLPVLNFFNRLLGGVFGLLKGAVFLFLACWLLLDVAGVLSPDAVSQTQLLRHFANFSPQTFLL